MTKRGMPGLINHPISFTKCQEIAVIRGLCTYVVDGDTYDILVDLGFLHFAMVTLRLKNINSPELNDKNQDLRRLGEKAQARATDLLQDSHVLVRPTKHRQSFGRFIADVWVTNDDINAESYKENGILYVDTNDNKPWFPIGEILLQEKLATKTRD